MSDVVGVGKFVVYKTNVVFSLDHTKQRNADKFKNLKNKIQIASVSSRVVKYQTDSNTDDIV